MKLLFLMPYGIGNLIILYPVLKKLHEKNISFDIVTYLKSVDYITRQWEPFRNLYQNNFFISNNIKDALKTLLKIRNESYDVSILSFPSARPHYNLLHYLCGAKIRVAAKYPDDSISSLSFLSTRQVPVEIGLHDTFQNLRLINAAGFAIEENEVEYFSVINKKEKRIGFHVGCKAADSYRRWPLQYWKQLIDMIKKEASGYDLVLFFGPDEYEELKFFEAIQGVTINKSLSLNALYDEISRCSVFVSNDSGLMHIAAFTGAYSVSVWGPSDFRRTGPFSKEAVIIHSSYPCRPCSHSYYRKSHRFNCPDKEIACLREITPQRVFDEVCRILRR